MTTARAVGAVSREAAEWYATNWQAIHRNVRRLQVRIVQATKASRWGKVRALQRLLTHSYSGKVLAVRRVTENTGKKTPGVDKEIWDAPEKKIQAVHALKRRGYQPQPLRRVYIPKSDGRTMRPLGIPTIPTKKPLSSFGGKFPCVNLIRYADDFIITGRTKELLEGEIKPLVEQFLQERGLGLSPAKTVITHVEKGFDFLGQNVRKYPNGKLLIKPSKKNVNIFLGGIRKTIRAAGHVCRRFDP